jgi:hypothetical protein
MLIKLPVSQAASTRHLIQGELYSAVIDGVPLCCSWETWVLQSFARMAWPPRRRSARRTTWLRKSGWARRIRSPPTFFRWGMVQPPTLHFALVETTAFRVCFSCARGIGQVLLTSHCVCRRCRCLLYELMSYRCVTFGGAMCLLAMMSCGVLCTSALASLAHVMPWVSLYS